MNYLFTKTALITLLTLAMTACASSRDAADIESELSPTSASGKFSNLNVQNEKDTDADLIIQANNSSINVDSLESKRLLELQAEIKTELSKRNLSNASETKSSVVDSTKKTFNKQKSGIKEGQFVHNGFDNQLKVEIVKVKRIQNPETQQAEDVVAVKLRVKRLQENVGRGINIRFIDSKARNVDTYEEYKTISGKYTNTTYFSNIPLNAWAEAYFWLKVPRGIEVIDIIIPKTAIFKNVPIEG